MPFYSAGKGIGVRMLQHVIDAAQLSEPCSEENNETSRKIARINNIRATGAEPVIWVLRYSMETEYTAVEAAAIDLLMSPVQPAFSPDATRVPLAEPHQLTNARREASHLAVPPLTASTPLLPDHPPRVDRLKEPSPVGEREPGSASNVPGSTRHSPRAGGDGAVSCTHYWSHKGTLGDWRSSR
jgi:hypothetical protein